MTPFLSVDSYEPSYVRNVDGVLFAVWDIKYSGVITSYEGGHVVFSLNMTCYCNAYEFIL